LTGPDFGRSHKIVRATPHFRTIAVVAIALLAVAVGCATQGAGMAKDQPLDRRRCSMVEVFPAGLRPSRPYRVLGPVSTDENNAEQALRESACRIGADAVIDFARETGISQSQSVGGSSAAIEARVPSSGTAIAYTDLPDAGS